MSHYGPSATRFEGTGKAKGRARIYLLIKGKWEWALTYDYRTGEVKLFLPPETIEAKLK